MPTGQLKGQKASKTFFIQTQNFYKQHQLLNEKNSNICRFALTDDVIIFEVPVIAKGMKVLACMFGQVERDERYQGGYDGE